MKSNKPCNYRVTVVVEEVQDKKREEIHKNVIAVRSSNVKADKSSSIRCCKLGKFRRKSVFPRSGGAHGGGGANGKVPTTRRKCVK